MTGLIDAFRARLSPECAADMDRFVAAYGVDVVEAALCLDKAEAKTRDALIRRWVRRGMTPYRIAKLLGTDASNVRRAAQRALERVHAHGGAA